MPHDTQKKQKLSNISFDHEGAHVALVGKHQGGPANGVETLLFKTKDTKHVMDQDLIEFQKEANVRVTLTFTEFLVRWFDLWWDEADVLAMLLGMEEDWINEPHAEDYKEMIQERVDDIELMKSAEKSLNKGELQQFIDSLSEEEYGSLRKAKRMLEKGLAEKGLASSGSPEDGKQEDTTNKSSGKPQDDNKGKQNMDQEELQKAIDKGREEGRSELQDELQKAQDKLEAIEKERKEKVQEEYEDLVKGYSFVEEGEQESLVKALMAVEGEKGANAIVDALEKAANVVKEFGGAQGADGEGDIDAVEKSRQRVREHIQKRNK